jgi:hypothetical protein
VNIWGNRAVLSADILSGNVGKIKERARHHVPAERMDSGDLRKLVCTQDELTADMRKRSEIWSNLQLGRFEPMGKSEFH